MKVVAYVPIKLNNSRLPGKNTKRFDDGTPLCELVFRTLSKVNGVDEKYCFCSSDEICQYLPQEIKFLKRNVRLDSSETRCCEIIDEFLKMVDADIIVLAHATSPFLSQGSIQKCIDAVKSNNYDSAFTVVKEQSFFWKDGKPLNFDAKVMPRSQDLPVYYKETNGVFVFTRKVFEELHQRVGKKPYLCEMNFPENIDINNPEDFVIANAIYSSELNLI